MSAVLLWLKLAKTTKEQFVNLVREKLQILEQTKALIEDNPKLRTQLRPQRFNEYSLCLNIYIPDESFLYEKYSLTHFEEKDYTQIMFLPHVTMELMKEFISDVEKVIPQEEQKQ